MSKNLIFKLSSFVVIAAVMLSACAAPTTEAPKPTAAPAMSEMDKLVDAAKKEGELNVIALPRDWANYGELLDGFKKNMA